MSEWVSAWTSIHTVSARLIVYPNEVQHQLLPRAIKEGFIRARMPGGTEIRKDGWHSKVDDKDYEVISHPDMHWRSMEINRRDLHDWLKSLEPKSGRPRGRKFTYDWHAAWIEVCLYLLDKGELPGDRNEIVAIMEEILEKAPRKLPDRSTQIEGFVRQLYETFEDKKNVDK